MGKIFGKPYAQKFVDGLSSDAKASFASALDDNGDFLRVDLDLGPTALQETYEADACAKCALSFGGRELQGIICYTSETAYDFVSYEPQDEIRFWEINAETCEITEILTHEKVTLGDLRLALGGGAGGGFDPADIPEGNILQNAVLGLNEDDELVKGDLFGRYVKVIPAPASTTLTEAEKESILGGAILEGDFLNIKNPMLFPGRLEGNELRYDGIAIGRLSNSESSYIGCYMIDATTNVISLTDRGFFNIGISRAQLGDITARAWEFVFDAVAVRIPQGLIIASKAFPAYPSEQTNKSYHLVLDNGTLAWREGNGLYLHTVVFTVSGSSGNITLTILSDSATPIAFDATTGNIVVENSSFIQFANCGNFVFTRYGANGFNPAIYEFDSATGTFSNAITLATVESDTVTPIG